MKTRGSASHYDAVVIGAGMSGLAAGIRLALSGRKTLILERHNAPGGLNGFYSFDGRKYDVGLHALTNFAAPGARRLPMVKLLRQLRLPREALDLNEQLGSAIAFGQCQLRFSNNIELLESEVEEAFPESIDGFRQLTAYVESFDDTADQPAQGSARQCLHNFIPDPLLREMLLCPLMYYGNPREHDMELAGFATLFKAIYLQGFARPFDGVRTIVRALLAKYRELGGERRMKMGVHRIIASAGRVTALVLDDGSEITADHILSSAGYAETLRLCSDQPEDAAADKVGRLSFVETITVFDRQPADFGWRDTIVFFNHGEKFRYACPQEEVDLRSGVICFPNNYDYSGGRQLSEGVFRITALANYNRWTKLAEPEYRNRKQHWFEALRKAALTALGQPESPPGFMESILATDMFTPRTVEKFTGHLGGAVYGASEKIRDARTHLANLYICGTDQGFLGITGAMLSGISVANRHVLGEAKG